MMGSQAIERATRSMRQKLANMLTAGKCLAVNDQGHLQTVQVEELSGAVRSDCVVLHGYGFRSVAPPGAPTCQVSRSGVNGEHLVLAVLDTSGGQKGHPVGDVVVYSPVSGAKVHMKASGQVEITAPGGVLINGDLVVTGDVSDGVGSMQDDRDVFNDHTHPQYSPGRVTHATTTPMGDV